jgi:curved DNA-binding protein CbpA
MGTLYDLLGALPSDDAEELRTAFRKAAKATHPDTNPDDPDADVRFRELMRAYDILTDADQRATYDHLLAIALQPETPPSTRTYETVRKVASNTMVASVISAMLVGGYTVFGFGLFSKAPSAAEMVAGLTAGGNLEVAALHPAAPAQEEPHARREADITTGSAGAMAAAAPAAKEPAPVSRLEAMPPFLTYNLGLPYYPRFANTYVDRDVVPYRKGALDRTLTDITAARRTPDLKRTKTAAPVLRRPPLMIVPVALERREREPFRESFTAALTP